MTGSFDQSAYLWNWETESNTADCLAVCRGHSETVTTIVKGPNLDDHGRVMHFATGSWDGSIKVWSASRFLY